MSQSWLWRNSLLRDFGSDGNMELRRSRGEEEKSRKAERSLGGSPLAYPARALVLFEFFDAAFNDLGEAYGAAFPLRGLV